MYAISFLPRTINDIICTIRAEDLRIARYSCREVDGVRTIGLLLELENLAVVVDRV